MTEYNLWHSLPTSPVQLQDSLPATDNSWLIGMVLVLKEEKKKKEKKWFFASAKDSTTSGGDHII